MKRIIITLMILTQVTFFAVAQNEETLEIQGYNVDSNSNPEIQLFYKKFNSWITNEYKESSNSGLKKELMVNDFIIFSEDGLFMKNLSFESVESCKKRIIKNTPKLKNQTKWIYISMENTVNKNELIKILTFLREQKIEYIFGKENDFVPQIMKNVE